MSSRVIFPWLNFINLLADKHVSPKLRKQILTLCPIELIGAIEEIVLNLQHFRVAISPETDKKLKHHKNAIKILANLDISLREKRKFLKSEKGRQFLMGALPEIIQELKQMPNGEES